MYALKKEAQAIFMRIIEEVEKNDGWVKFKNNTSFMPLSAEFLYSNSTGKIFSLAHYGELNGDLMKDPDMTFIVYPSGLIYPYEYQNDYLGKYQKCIEFGDSGNIITTSQNLCKSMTEFANIWLLNISEQQNIKP